MSKDLLVIGAGPGGYPAAFHAADRGMKVTLVDPEPNPGGVCLYRGCIPSKTFLNVAGFLHQTQQAAAWGVELEQPGINIEKLRAWKDSVVENLTKGLGQLVKQRGIEYICGRAVFKDGRHAVINVEGEAEREVAFQNAIIASGSVPSVVPGLPDSPRIIDSTGALDLADIPQRLLVIGGGYIGLELGQVYAALGAQVTVVEMTSGILPGVDRELARILKKRLDKQFAAVLTKTAVEQMTDTKKGMRVVFKGEHTGEELFDKVLVAVGRKPCTDGLGLENTKIKLTENGFIETDAQRRTAEQAVFAIGDVAGQPMLAHKATYEARVAVEVCLDRKTVYDPRAVPCVVFTDPEIAWCGLTQAEAEEQGRDVKVTTFPWAASGRALTLGRREGVTKLLFDPESGRLLGAGIAGHGAGELLAEAVLGIEMGAVADDLAWTIHAHPTLSETIMEAAAAFSGHPTHFMRPR